MIAYGDVKIFCGNSNPEFAKTVCKELGLDLGKAVVKTFADGEVSVSLEETVRASDVFLIQSTCKPVNDNLMELLVMIDACRRASAGRITAVIPYFGYARQDRKAKSRDPISAKPNEVNEANLLRLCDVHNIPVATNIATAEALIHALERGDLDWRDIVNPKR